MFSMIYINIDDFGLDKTIDDTVEELFNLRRIKSTSVIVNLDSKRSINSLKKIKGIKVNLHLNLVSGNIISKDLKKFLGLTVFPNSDYWLSQKFQNLPPKEMILDEFYSQFRILIENGVKVTGVDYHQRYPMNNPYFWDVYKVFINKTNLLYRGNKFHYTNSNLIKTTTPGSIHILLSSLKNNTFNTLSNLLLKNESDYGSYISDFGLVNNSKNILKIIKHHRENNPRRDVEIISHACRIKNKNLSMYKSRYEEYINIIKLTNEFI